MSDLIERLRYKYADILHREAAEALEAQAAKYRKALDRITDLEITVGEKTAEIERLKKQLDYNVAALTKADNKIIALGKVVEAAKLAHGVYDGSKHSRAETMWRYLHEALAKLEKNDDPDSS